ncbi:MAG: cupin domain-containing protein [Candidatus Shapirobacteria bacterium]
MNTPQNINQLINFQYGSVVSKEIINKPSGTITLFAFDQGQGLSEHTAPYDAFILAVEGSAEITVSGIKNIVKLGESLLMPANSPHSLKALKPFKMLLTMIKS